MEYIEILRDGGTIICGKITKSPSLDDTHVRNSKKSKRRSKALKVKLQKMKSAELVERLNTKKPFEIEKNHEENPIITWEYELDKLTENDYNYLEDEPPPPKCSDKDFLKEDFVKENEHKKFGSRYKIYMNPNDEDTCKNNYTDDECVLVNAIKNSILKDDVKTIEEKLCEKAEAFSKNSKSDWKILIKQLPFVNVTSELTREAENLNNYSPSPKLYSQLFVKDANMPSKFHTTIKYLTNLLEKIIDEYNVHWQIDSELEKEVFENTKGNFFTLIADTF